MLEKKYLKWEDIEEHWEDSNWLWEEVSTLVDVDKCKNRKYLKWDDIEKNWEDSNWLWEDVFTCMDAIRPTGNSDYSEYVKGNPWEQRKKSKKLIKLYCKVNNIEYEKVVESGKDIKVTASEFENFIKEGISIKVNI